MSSAGKSSGSNVSLSKGIVIVFFTIFLVIYGVFITSFLEIYGEDFPVYLSYLPLVCYVGAVFLGLAFLYSLEM